MVPGIEAALEALAARGLVYVVSNHVEPAWFRESLGAQGIQFAQIISRQNGANVRKWAEDNDVEPHRVLVLAGSRDDVAMAKNAGACLVGAGWSQDKEVAALGVQVEAPEELLELASLLDGWQGKPWRLASCADYSVCVLSDISTINGSWDQQTFGNRVRRAVKEGTPTLRALLALTVGTAFRLDLEPSNKQAWGVYPSSKTSIEDEVTLSEFTHRLRTTASRMHMARKGQPLFVRHQPAPKRSAREGGPREDPTSEIASMHLNHVYKGKLKGRHVIVVDDCTTFGVSMGVAAALLKQAGAARVTGLAIGQFGRRLRPYSISVKGDPFAPIDASAATWRRIQWEKEETSVEGQATLRKLLLGT